jgi:hypothetical protein
LLLLAAASKSARYRCPRALPQTANGYRSIDIRRIQSFNVNRTVLTQLASIQFSRITSCSGVSEEDEDDKDGDDGPKEDSEYIDSCSKEACLARNDAYKSESDGDRDGEPSLPILLGSPLLFPGEKKASPKSSYTVAYKRDNNSLRLLRLRCGRGDNVFGLLLDRMIDGFSVLAEEEEVEDCCVKASDTSTTSISERRLVVVVIPPLDENRPEPRRFPKRVQATTEQTFGRGLILDITYCSITLR